MSPASSTCSMRAISSRVARSASAASATAASVSACSPYSSSRARWALRRNSDWRACWPWMSTSFSPSSRSSRAGIGAPLIQQRLRPSLATTRRITHSLSSSSSCSASHARAAGASSRMKRAEMSARSAPSRTAAASARSPRIRLSASTRIDLPAPVSPDSTVMPASNSTSSLSMIAKFRIVISASMIAWSFLVLWRVQDGGIFWPRPHCSLLRRILK